MASQFRCFRILTRLFKQTRVSNNNNSKIQEVISKLKNSKDSLTFEAYFMPGKPIIICLHINAVQMTKIYILLQKLIYKPSFEWLTLKCEIAAQG